MAPFFTGSRQPDGGTRAVYPVVGGASPSHVELKVPIVDLSTAPQLVLWPSYATGIPPIECSELPSTITQTP